MQIKFRLEATYELKHSSGINEERTAAHTALMTLRGISNQVFSADALANSGLSPVHPSDLSLFSTPYLPKATTEIPAWMSLDHSDVRIPFDAADWMQSADNDTLMGLVGEGFGAGDISDEIARHASTRDINIATLFDYLGLLQRFSQDAEGYSCRVDKKATLAFIKSNRQALYAELVDEGQVVDLEFSSSLEGAH